jgi:hypothetical protein
MRKERYTRIDALHRKYYNAFHIRLEAFMKNRVLLLSLLSLALSTGSAVAAELSYSCWCSGKKQKCSGSENLNVAFESESIASFDLGSEDWEMNDGFTGEIDETKAAHAGFTAFKVTEGGGGYAMENVVFHVEDGMIAGAQSGKVKLYWESERGGDPTTTTYSCVMNDESSSVESSR